MKLIGLRRGTMPKLVEKKLVNNEHQPIGKSYWFRCPGCDELHRYVVRIDGGKPSWTFNGNFDKPTFTPSLRIFIPEMKSKNAEGQEITLPESTCCHLFLTDGILDYCTDNPHKLNGQKVPLPDIPEDSWVLRFGE